MHGHHTHGHGFGARMGHGGSKSRRGEMPTAVLALLREQDMHGYQMLQEIAERTGGAWTPSPGSIYPALKMLEHQGMVSSEGIGGKRVFCLTKVGRKHAAMIPEGSPWKQLAEGDEPQRDLRESAAALSAAIAQISRLGTAEQITKASALLNAARKDIYAMLASDE